MKGGSSKCIFLLCLFWSLKRRWNQAAAINKQRCFMNSEYVSFLKFISFLPSITNCSTSQQLSILDLVD